MGSRNNYERMVSLWLRMGIHRSSRITSGIVEEKIGTFRLLSTIKFETLQSWTELSCFVSFRISPRKSMTLILRHDGKDSRFCVLRHTGYLGYLHFIGSPTGGTTIGGWVCMEVLWSLEYQNEVKYLDVSPYLVNFVYY